MSVQPVKEPQCTRESGSPVELRIEGRTRDLGGFAVRRLLPSSARRLVGPFIFFDHFGPAVLPPGEGLDVRPHPHINLATVTYLFEGEILHRDSLGSEQVIRPGAINWMTAGRGIVHSERSSPEQRAAGPKLHGLQLWVALPREHEETDPAFFHHAARSLPEAAVDDVRIRVLAGSAYGSTSPVETFSPLFYVEVFMPAGSSLPLPADYPERALYVVEGRIDLDGETAEPGCMLVLHRKAAVRLQAQRETRLVMLGGDPLDGERHIWWNFVSTRRERIEQAKADWKSGRFPAVPGDEDERIPLPD